MNQRFQEIIWPVVPLVLALLVTTLLLLLAGASPFEAYLRLFEGAFGDMTRTASVLALTVPLLFASAGLLVTFTAGLWNIGIEGQIVMGAIAASAMARILQAAPETWGPLARFLGSVPPLLVILELLAAAGAGALWAMLSGILKTRGKVHEIFSGLALSNIALIFSNFLISGPWQPPEGGSLQGTHPFNPAALLPTLEGSRLSIISLVIAAIALAAVYVALRGTFWGLKLKALGNNPRSAFLLGVSSEREVLLAFAACGALAGLAGAVRVISFYENLRPLISGGLGYLSILVVLLSGIRAVWVPFIVFFFAAVLKGSVLLQTRLSLHQSVGGILSGALVLLALLLGERSAVFARGRRVPREVLE